jgi:S-layer family protein
MDRMHFKQRLALFVALGLLTLISAAIGYAAETGGFDLSWNTVDGGGGRSTTNGNELTGDVGQPDASILTYSTVYTLYGGFYWAGPVATPCPNCTTATPMPSPTACALTFTDVPAGSTFYPYIRCMACRGIVAGYPDGTFKPGNYVTRGQLSKIVSNSAGYDEDPGARIYEDVPEGSAFYPFIQRLSNRSIMNGYRCGGTGEPCVTPNNRPYFRPYNTAKRGQVAKIVSSTADFQDQPTGQTFQDVPPNSTFYTWIARLSMRDIINGYQCGGPGEPCVAPANLPYFRPSSNVTRGQASKIVSNTFFPDCQTPGR